MAAFSDLFPKNISDKVPEGTQKKKMNFSTMNFTTMIFSIVGHFKPGKIAFI
jgi:hypothetical protein